MLDAWNSSPPKSTLNPDTIGIFSDGRSPYVLLVMIHQGCVWAASVQHRRAVLPGDERA